MGDQGLFREEALRRFREGGTRGQVLRLAPGWTRVAFALLWIVAVVAVACLFLVQVPVAVHGPAAVTEKGGVLALLPASSREAVAREGRLLWRGVGSDAVLQIERIEPRSVTREEAGSLGGGLFRGRPLSETSVVVWATVDPRLWIPLHGHGTVSLHERRVPLYALFWSGAR